MGNLTAEELANAVKISTYIAQIPQIQAPQSPTDLTAWGVMGVSAYLILKEAIQVFRQQNNQESKIINELMARQRDREDRMEKRHDEVLIEIKEILAKTQATISQQQSMINEMTRQQANQTRAYAENAMGVRAELRDLGAGITELLRRSDESLKKQ